MFGYNFFLDNRLSIKHLPPKKSSPVWERVREDIYRFMYEKSKIDNQVYMPNMRKISAEEFDPYPGEFLKQGLEDKIFKSNLMLAMKYLAEDNKEAVDETMKNIYISKYEANPKYDTFTEYVSFQKRWVDIIKTSAKKIEDIRDVLKVSIDEANDYQCENVNEKEKVKLVSSITGFDVFTKSQVKTLSKKMCIRVFEENKKLFEIGDENSDIFFIIDGEVRIIKYTDFDEEILVGEICKGEIIGETSFVKEKHEVSGIINKTAIVGSINKKDIKDLFVTDADFENKMLKVFIDKLHKKLGSLNKLHSELVMKNESIAD